MTEMSPRDRQSARRIADAILIASSKAPADAKRWIMRAREPDGALTDDEAAIVMQEIGLRDA